MSVAWGQSAPIEIVANLTDAPRRLYHAEVYLPVKPGPVDLITPQWIPGEHRPTGPVENITGVVFTANGKKLAWRRDDVNMYEFHLTIPQGVTRLHAHLDCIVTARVSEKLAVLEWEKLLLYPAHVPVREIPIQPSVKVPAGWGIGTALRPASVGLYPVLAAGRTERFAETNVEQLQDSPLITGEYFREYELAPEITPKHYIDVVADYPEDANLRPELVSELSNLVREASALYASHHYREYHFLLTLSNMAGEEGLEHGQSSDNGVGEKGFADAAHQLSNADLLPHEFTHSWNGKYRRPAGLYQQDFATAQQGALLWVYEGMTQYLGYVLAARSGFETPAQFRDIFAQVAAEMEYTPGRDWRSTEDTAVSSSILRHDDPAWSNWRRGQDYYFEGALLWLDADTLIRKMTDNRKSLADFEKIFVGKGGNTGPLIVTYDFDELVKDLNEVVPYDWAAFLRDRVYKIDEHADLEGIERGGYKLAFADQPSATEKTLLKLEDRLHGGFDCWYSIGLKLTPGGQIVDVRWGGPADKAKLAPREKIIAVDDRVFSRDAMHDAIRAAKNSKEPIRLIVQADEFVKTAEIDYHGGEQYPMLERVGGTPDYLDDVTKALTKGNTTKSEKGAAME
ncbi:MAG TPA: M61 family peptidase [Terracidiphilus sp.]|nr:M61 family peptidase [Terracidiphilus sp.]